MYYSLSLDGSIALVYIDFIHIIFLWAANDTKYWSYDILSIMRIFNLHYV